MDGNLIDKKMQSHHVYKTRFLCKVKHLKDQGNKNDLLEKVFRWVSENHDKTYGRRINSLKEIEGDLPEKRAPQFEKGLKFNYAKTPK